VAASAHASVFVAGGLAARASIDKAMGIVPEAAPSGRRRGRCAAFSRRIARSAQRYNRRLGEVEGSPVQKVLNLRAGALVEVRSADEILRTLDEHGTLDSLPFMPEMLRFCGKRFRVYSRAEKACDTIDWGSLRRMENAVHLEALRCDGSAHGGCQAGCLIYWKEAWLKRVSALETEAPPGPSAPAEKTPPVTIETLTEATTKGVHGGERVYSCQATELVRATSELPWWQPMQYVRDVRVGNASVGRVARGLAVGFFNKLQQANKRLLPRLMIVCGGNEYPFLRGRLSGEPPVSELNVQPGDIVEVKSKDEILDTLDEGDRTRGLRFDREMLRYCGRQGRVLRRVEHIINEQTGKMLTMRSDCVIIDGFICTGDLHRFCPRSIYPYWRESWLKRIDPPPPPASSPVQPVEADC
jgi:hypothetical protein